uniref:Uncharacterized protein n=1 Tax=Anopheles albimanus TaxID=7167 RepID=A0A182F664_ANOAL
RLQSASNATQFGNVLIICKPTCQAQRQAKRRTRATQPDKVLSDSEDQITKYTPPINRAQGELEISMPEIDACLIAARDMVSGDAFHARVTDHPEGTGNTCQLQTPCSL